MNYQCPHCHAPLQENARFCPHCMAQLGVRQTIKTPKPTANKTKRLVCILLAVVLLLAGAGGGFAVYYRHQHAPICSYEQFQAAVPLVSERMELDSLWDTDGFIDTHFHKKEKAVQYTTDVYLNDAYLSLFFVNKGEQVCAYFCDIQPSDFDDAARIIKCIAQSAANNYITDIDAVFDDEVRYPKSTLPVPFEDSFTDMLLRTEQYNADIESGTAISTKYIQAYMEEFHFVYYVTERNTAGNLLYDLALVVEGA